MAQPEANAVTSLKIPQFWTQSPASWFINVEAQFSTRHITQEQTKYEHVVQNLPANVIDSVLDLINPDQPSATPYTDLKRALMDRHSLSTSKRIEQLLSGEEIGDRKPSEFYRRLKTLAGQSPMVTEQLIIELWYRRLPPMVTALTKSSGKTDVKDLIQMADTVFETMQQQNFAINAIASSSSHLATNSESNLAIAELTMQNQRLQSEISEIRNMLSKINFHGRSRSRGRSNFRQRTPSRKRGNDMCYYHRRFGNKANKCEPPCKFDAPK